MDRPIIIIGAGVHAKVLLDALLLSGRKVLGLTEFDNSKWDTSIWGIPVLGNDDCINKYNSEEIELVNGMGSVGSMEKRYNIFSFFKEKGYTFAKVIHPGALISPYSEILEGAQLLAGCVVNPGAVIGNNSIINTRASIDHDVRIGDHVHIAPGATVSGGVTIGDNVHVGTGASIIQSVSVGDNSLIAAGSVVISNVMAGAKVYGVPAKEVSNEL